MPAGAAIETPKFQFDSSSLDDFKEGRPPRTAVVEGPPALPNPAIKFEGNNEWSVVEDNSYSANDGYTITVKKGFRTDLASIPRFCWVLIASYELSVVAPVFHDLIYRSGGGVVRAPDGRVEPGAKVFTRREADDLFLELMTRAKVSYWKRNVAYLAVEYFGASAWKGRVEFFGCPRIRGWCVGI